MACENERVHTRKRINFKRNNDKPPFRLKSNLFIRTIISLDFRSYISPLTPKPNRAKSPKHGSLGKTSANAAVILRAFFNEKVSVSVSLKKKATRQTCVSKII